MTWIKTLYHYYRHSDGWLKLVFLSFLASILCACAVVYGHFKGWWV